MESSTSSLKINHLREKRCMYNRIKAFAMNANGILFGGVVRDDMIGKHYRNEFIKNGNDFDKYWDDRYSKETKHRLIMPNDVDVFFRTENNSAIFIEKLREFVKEFNGTVSVTEDRNFRQFEYTNMMPYLRHKIIVVSILIGKTLFKRGSIISAKIDLIEIKSNDSNLRSNYDFARLTSSVEPPFHNLDFLCNIFIMEKTSSGDFTVRVSNATGTPIDDMTFIEKSRFTTRVIDDIINFRTQFTRSIDGYYTEYINCYRIMKMINREVSWDITNIPFRTNITIDDIKDVETHNCCICLEGINNSIVLSNEIVEINTYKSKQGNYLHLGCFIEYMMKEQRRKYFNAETQQIECRCPFRGIFKFRDCHKTINYS